MLRVASASDGMANVACSDSQASKLLALHATSYLRHPLHHHRPRYLAVVLDLYSRRVVGWKVSDAAGAGVVLEALRRGPAAVR